MHNHRILIIEDDTDLADMLRRYFERLSYEVAVANQGQDGLEMARQMVIDIILLDIRLPDINGYDVCRQLRKQRATAHVPVMFLTERRERKDKLLGLELGAIDYVTKPFDIQELHFRVRNAIRRARVEPPANNLTGFPDGKPVRDKIKETLQTESWGAVIASMSGLAAFRDRYGFVAADDVTRAVGLILRNTIENNCRDEVFVGHIDASDFILLTTLADHAPLEAACRERLHAAIQYFYPAHERPEAQSRSRDRLAIQVLSITSLDGAFDSLDALRGALMALAE